MGPARLDRSVLTARRRQGRDPVVSASGTVAGPRSDQVRTVADHQRTTRLRRPGRSPPSAAAPDDVLTEGRTRWWSDETFHVRPVSRDPAAAGSGFRTPGRHPRHRVDSADGHGRADQRFRGPHPILFYLFGGLTFAAALLPGGRRVGVYRIARQRDRCPEAFRKDLTALFELLAKGGISPLIADRLPLDQAAQAHDRLRTAPPQGKLVLLGRP
ncbi:zinc-binding dehydrogenase [Planomonospora sphaerica]|uniref:zinc-binding dehydrogenase n=1 Tax=Planomonospora sphaerica TaxID=161355 RepID=UPI0012905BEF